jgi:hypothetical protein
VATLHWASRCIRASDLLQPKSVTIALEFTLKFTRVRFGSALDHVPLLQLQLPSLHARATPGRIVPRANTDITLGIPLLV